MIMEGWGVGATKVEKPYHNNKHLRIRDTFTCCPTCQAERLCVMEIDNSILEEQKKREEGIFASMCAFRAAMCLNNKQQWLP